MTGMKPKKPSKSSVAAFADPEIQHIEQLLRFMTEHNLEEFEYANGDLKIRLKKPSVSAGAVSRPLALPEIIVAGGGNSAGAAPAPATPGAKPSDAR